MCNCAYFKLCCIMLFYHLSPDRETERSCHRTAWLSSVPLSVLTCLSRPEIDTAGWLGSVCGSEDPRMGPSLPNTKPLADQKQIMSSSQLGVRRRVAVAGEAVRRDPMAEASYDIRHSPSAPNMAEAAEEFGSGQELQSLQGSLKSNSLGTWPAVAFSPNWIIPYQELVRCSPYIVGLVQRTRLDC